MSTNEYSKRRELKELLKVEIKNKISEFGPLSTFQNLVGGILGKITDKRLNVVNKDYDRKIAKVKQKEKAAYEDLLKFAKKLEKKYKTWEKVPIHLKNDIDDLIPDVAKKLKNI